ncbi:hypothetical protein [Nonomuraea sp. NPDC049141]|uniref:hypothetical protein n=1 Tax=Nonomuraea sp. NPDC049141 TaxID=3155500 RepID=UPI0033FEE60C
MAAYEQGRRVSLQLPQRFLDPLRMIGVGEVYGAGGGAQQGAGIDAEGERHEASP